MGVQVCPPPWGSRCVPAPSPSSLRIRWQPVECPPSVLPSEYQDARGGDLVSHASLAPQTASGLFVFSTGERCRSGRRAARLGTPSQACARLAWSLAPHLIATWRPHADTPPPSLPRPHPQAGSVAAWPGLRAGPPCAAPGDRLCLPSCPVPSALTFRASGVPVFAVALAAPGMKTGSLISICRQRVLLTLWRSAPLGAGGEEVPHRYPLQRVPCCGRP